MKIVLVYNPQSGSAPSLRQLRTICKKQGIAIETALPISDHLEKDLAPHLKKDKIIAAVGGDGTLSSVAGLLAGSDAVFAPLPGGTLNHFTKDLGISQELSIALRNLTQSTPKRIDVASVNGIVFVNNSSIGVYPSSLSARTELESKQVTKWIAAIIASLRAFVRYKSYTVTIEGETFKTPFLFVGNNDYHLDSIDKPGRTKLTQAILSAYTITSASRLRLLKIFAYAVAGKLQMANDVRIWKTKTLTVHTKKQRIRVSRDGELEYLQTPLHYKSLARQVRVLGS